MINIKKESQSSMLIHKTIVHFSRDKKNIIKNYVFEHLKSLSKKLRRRK